MRDHTITITKYNPRKTLLGAHIAMSVTALDADYAKRIDAEKSRFARDVNVHDLPDIFHYWSNKYLAPKLHAVGLKGPYDIFADFFERAAKVAGGTAKFVSIGAGNLDTEIIVAKMLRARGVTDFQIECLELSPVMLERGQALAVSEGVSEHIIGLEADFNTWEPQHVYDGYMANQSLHHVTNLEGLFDRVRASLAPHGWFAVSDIIGRNGHLRWPEALEIVQEFWQQMPPSHRYNHLLGRSEPVYENWDCSHEGFEGIRAQDILPLLVERFNFETFLVFGNLIDIFVDRAFGHNFMVDSVWDTHFIDRIEARDDAEMRAGTLKPSHLIAAMSTQAVGAMKFIAPLTPTFSIRPSG